MAEQERWNRCRLREQRCDQAREMMTPDGDDRFCKRLVPPMSDQVLGPAAKNTLEENCKFEETTDSRCPKTPGHSDTCSGRLHVWSCR